MPLTKTNVTAASRRMLPTYPIFFATIGLGLLLTSHDRLIQTPTFHYADTFVSIRYWGAGFLALSLAFLAALALRRRRGYQIALTVAIVWMSLWAAVTAASTLTSPSSFTAWAWPAFIARACWASLVSLETRET